MYNLRSSKESYRTSYGRKVKTPERLTTGAFQVIQEAITLAITEQAQSSTVNEVPTEPMYDRKEFISEVINYCNQTHGEMGKDFEKYADEQIELATKHHEVLAVGEGIGGGFLDTSKLKPMKYKQAMSTKDKDQWMKAVEDEYN